jgi:iron complex transport system substrate-binding protein
MSLRIISLLPAATEIICALGLEANLVGRSHECDYPLSITHLPVCSEARFLSGASSKQIDNEVKSILADALSIYSVNRDKIQQLQPDFIVTQAQCDVCAVSLKDVEKALAGLLNKQAQIISVQPNTLSDVFKDIETIAAQFGANQQGAELIEHLHERVDIITHKLKYNGNKPTVACIEWLEPLMVSGNWLPELVDIAGGQSVLARAGEHSPYIDQQTLIQTDPEVIVVMPCGFSIARTLAEIDVLLSMPGFTSLSAVKNNRLYIADGNHYFNRSGPRLVDSVEILAEIINPKQFVFGYEAEGWIKFTL